MEFLYLSEPDMIKAGVEDMARCMETMEETMRLLCKGDYRMGGKDSNDHGLSIYFPNESKIEGMPLNRPDYRITAMPAYLGGKYHMAGFKTYGSNIDNLDKGLPRSILMVSLLDAGTGVPVAYMSANILSAMRTGAMAGLGAKYFARPNYKSVGIVGPGNMSVHTMKSFMCANPYVEVVKIKGRSKAGIDKFIEVCQRCYPNVKSYIVCDSYEEVCRDTDVIFYCATRAEKLEDTVYFKYEWLKKGSVLISGSPTFADEELYKAKDVNYAVDNFQMFVSSAQGIEYPAQRNVWASLGMGIYDAVTMGWIEREDVIDIGSVINNERQFEYEEDRITVYSIGGMAIEDVAWGTECYKKAISENIGTKLKLW